MLNILYNDFEDFEPDQLKNFIGQLRETTGNTFNLTENLLDWAHLRRDGINYKPEKFSVAEIVEENIELYNSQAQKKEISLQNNISGSEVVFADEEMVKTIIRNLMGNAIKFTGQNGTITLSAQNKGNHLWVSVTDTGKGMDAWEIEQLFKLENRHSTLGTNQEKGSGLGLILAHEFVIKNGGTIRVESTKGAGSTFSFSLPLKPAAQ